MSTWCTSYNTYVCRHEMILIHTISYLYNAELYILTAPNSQVVIKPGLQQTFHLVAGHPTSLHGNIENDEPSEVVNWQQPLIQRRCETLKDIRYEGLRLNIMETSQMGKSFIFIHWCYFDPRSGATFQPSLPAVLPACRPWPITNSSRLQLGKAQASINRACAATEVLVFATI